MILNSQKKINKSKNSFLSTSDFYELNRSKISRNFWEKTVLKFIKKIRIPNLLIWPQRIYFVKFSETTKLDLPVANKRQLLANSSIRTNKSNSGHPFESNFHRIQHWRSKIFPQFDYQFQWRSPLGERRRQSPRKRRWSNLCSRFFEQEKRSQPEKNPQKYITVWYTVWNFTCSMHIVFGFQKFSCKFRNFKRPSIRM